MLAITLGYDYFIAMPMIKRPSVKINLFLKLRK